MKEICFILTGETILWIYVGTQTKIPDARERWETIWEHRDVITEIVHTHPGSFLGFSSEDETTMEAVEAGTGKAFTWSIVTEAGYLKRFKENETREAQEPWWIHPLRDLSFGVDNQKGATT